MQPVWTLLAKRFFCDFSPGMATSCKRVYLKSVCMRAHLYASTWVKSGILQDEATSRCGRCARTKNCCQIRLSKGIAFLEMVFWSPLLDEFADHIGLWSNNLLLPKAVLGPKVVSWLKRLLPTLDSDPACHDMQGKRAGANQGLAMIWRHWLRGVTAPGNRFSCLPWKQSGSPYSLDGQNKNKNKNNSL